MGWQREETEDAWKKFKGRFHIVPTFVYGNVFTHACREIFYSASWCPNQMKQFKILVKIGF